MDIFVVVGLLMLTMLLTLVGCIGLIMVIVWTVEKLDEGPTPRVGGGIDEPL